MGSGPISHTILLHLFYHTESLWDQKKSSPLNFPDSNTGSLKQVPDSNVSGAELVKDSETRRREAAVVFEPIAASLDMIKKLVDKQRDIFRMHIQNIRLEVFRRINATLHELSKKN